MVLPDLRSKFERFPCLTAAVVHGQQRHAYFHKGKAYQAGVRLTVPAVSLNFSQVPQHKTTTFPIPLYVKGGRGGKQTLRQTCPGPRPWGAICVQRFDGSRNSAIHTTYRISLRSSSLREPRYPLLRVVFVSRRSCEQAIAFRYWFEWEKQPARCEPGPHSRAGKTAGLQVTAKREPLAARPTWGCSRCGYDGINDPSAGSPTETLLRLLLPLDGRV